MRNTYQNINITTGKCNYGSGWGGWYNGTEQQKEEKRYAKSMSESLKAAHEITRTREK